MLRAPKLCNVPTCTRSQPCPDHPKIAWEGSTRRTELPPDWERRRRRVLARDEICTLGTTCGGLGLSVEVHHRGDKHDHDLANLAGVCKSCHRAATLAQATEARSRA
jgi:5-methylcytosine-specific restriction protein A